MTLHPLGDDTLHTRRGVVERVVLPDANDYPAGRGERHVRFFVSLAVPVDLGGPPCRVAPRDPAMLRAPMPETPVDEHGDLRAREGNVDGPARNPRNRLLHPESKTACMERLPEPDLRERVSARVLGHPLGDGRGTCHDWSLRGRAGRVPVKPGDLPCDRHRLLRAGPHARGTLESPAGPPPLADWPTTDAGRFAASLPREVLLND